MKRFKQFFAVAAIAICCMVMTSCEDIARSEIYGSWLYSEQYYDDYDRKYEYYKELTFTLGGNYEMYIEEYLDNRFYDDYYESGSYFCNGWDMELTYYDSSIGYVTDTYSYEVYGDKLILEYYMNGKYCKEIYYRE